MSALRKEEVLGDFITFSLFSQLFTPETFDCSHRVQSAALYAQRNLLQNAGNQMFAPKIV